MGDSLLGLLGGFVWKKLPDKGWRSMGKRYIGGTYEKNTTGFFMPGLQLLFGADLYFAGSQRHQ